MREICGDISATNRLTRSEIVSYLFGNFVRGIVGYWSLLPISFWRGQPKVEGTESPPRTYLNAYLAKELPRLVSKKHLRVLDIGCGNGYLRKVLTEDGFSGEYTGVDIVDERAPDPSASPAFVSHFVGTAIATASIGNGYDLVISNTALEHIPDDSEAARIAYNALAPGGVGVHIVPSFWSLFLYLCHGYRQYTPRRIERVFSGQPYHVARLGGLASFKLHFWCITLPERLFGGMPIRRRSWYPKAVGVAHMLDRFLPFCSSVYVVVIRKPDVI